MTSATRERETDYTWTSPSWVARLREPLTTYYLLIGLLVFMVGFGLLMVLSASMVKSIHESGSPFTVFRDQLIFVAVGAVGAYAASRVRPGLWRHLAVPGMLVALGLQALVFSSMGVTVNGNTNWVRLGGFQIQPSEFGKLALIVFGATVLAKKWKALGQIFQALVPFVVPGAAVLMALVLMGKDLGTALVYTCIVVGMLFAAGIPLKWFGLLGLTGAAGAAFLALTSSNRMERIDTWLHASCTNPMAGNGACWQIGHAKLAFGLGGWWGAGLGESKEKWSRLSEPHNDFILPIIGEELGIPGTLLVLALYIALAWACYRLIAQSQVMFIRLATAGVMVWILAQAMINIGSVTGLIPIIGVPLPLISSGGSALIATMVAMGMLISFARCHPDVAAARAGHTGLGLASRLPWRR